MAADRSEVCTELCGAVEGGSTPFGYCAIYLWVSWHVHCISEGDHVEVVRQNHNSAGNCFVFCLTNKFGMSKSFCGVDIVCLFTHNCVGLLQHLDSFWFLDILDVWYSECIKRKTLDNKSQKLR